MEILTNPETIASAEGTDSPVGDFSPSPGSQLSEAMMAWSRAWKLDGDLCRCRKCNRAIIVSRTDEAFRHAAECPQSHLIAPWQDLRSRIHANIQLTNATAAELRSIVTTYITGGHLTSGDVVTAMTIIANILAKLPPPREEARK